jgi:hypothetical protein
MIVKNGDYIFCSARCANQGCPLNIIHLDHVEEYHSEDHSTQCGQSLPMEELQWKVQAARQIA